MNSKPWDRILSVDYYHDGPILGAADCLGTPHVFERQFDAEADEYSDRSLLSEIAADLLTLVLERQEIWHRWHAAYRRGEAGINSHPTLPEDHPRYDEVARLIGDRLRPDADKATTKWARFRGTNLRQLEVQWLDAPADPR